MRKLLSIVSFILIILPMSQANANTENMYERLVNDWSTIFPDGNRNAAGPRFFKYILDHFNIIMIVGDYNGGVQFINSCNESDMFKKEKLEIGVFDPKLDNPHDYEKDLRDARRGYNKSSNTICILRKPVSNWIRSANEMLQTAFDRKKLYFAATAMDDNYSMQKAKKIPIKELKFSKYEDEKNVGAKMIDFIEHQKEKQMPTHMLILMSQFMIQWI